MRRVLAAALALGALAACEIIAPIDAVNLGDLGGAGDGGPSGDAAGRVFHVGPTRQYTTLSQVAPLLAPGDRVEVDGDATYTDDVTFTIPGTKDAPITIQGIRANGKRPLLVGNQTTVHLNASHYVFQGFEVTSGNFACILHQADDVTIRDSVVHDCAKHGILGADVESGSLTIDDVETYAIDTAVDVATDQARYPGSVFRIQNSFLHNTTAGAPDGGTSLNLVSRAERTEIYANWIEGARDSEMSLVGPDGAPTTVAMDADVVGNVVRKVASTFHAVRLGDDGSGPSKGRYRFVANTFALGGSLGAGIHVTGEIESIEVHDSVFARPDGGDVSVVDLGEATWTTGAPVLAGAANWLPTNATNVPSQWTATLTGSDPGFVDFAGGKLWPANGSPLVDKGVLPTQSPPGFPFPNPLAAPTAVPPRATLPPPGSVEARAIVGAIDLGAYELSP